MITSLPLKNKHILIPREKKQAKSFSEIVKKLGGVPVEIPLLAFKPTELTMEIESAIHKLSQYDWVIFTSKVTVETFLSFVGVSTSDFPKIAAIGEKTAKALSNNGLQVHFIPAKFMAEAFISELSSQIKQGTKVLIPKGNLARNLIAEQLRNLGAKVDEVIVYETFFPPESKAALRQKVIEQELDIIPFTSPSTVDHFMEVIKENELWDELSSFTFACIGPVAKKRAESYGLPVHAVPSVYTVEGMVKEIAHYISEN